jgi:hypothetical protein
MTPDQLTECMHAVLDGTATAEQSLLLDVVLASDADAVAEFAQWKSMFGAIAAMPMAHPPEGLVATIDAAIPARAPARQKYFSAADQLLDSGAVLASRQTTKERLPSGFRAFFRRSNRPDSSPQEYGQMNVNRKYWAGGAIAAVALGVAIVAGGLPPKSENVTGTVVPAERYRAPQAGADAVKVGDPVAAPAAISTATSTGAEAAKADAGMKADLKADRADASMKADLKADRADASLKADLKADRADASLKAQRTDAQMMADKADAGMKADLKADRADASMKADRRADRTDASLKAQRVDAQMMADKADAALMAQRRADLAAKADAAAKAEKAAN